MMPSIQKIWDICQVFFEAYNIPIVYLDPHLDLVFELPVSNGTKSFYPTIMASLLPEQKKEPSLVMTHRSELSLIQPVLGTDSQNGVLLLGPILPFRLREEQLKGVINDSSDLKDKQRALLDLQSMTVLNQDQLTGLGLLLHYMIYEEPLNREVIGLLKIYPPNEKENKGTDALLSQNRQSEQFHHDLSFDQHYFDSIEKGDKEAFLYWQTKIPEEELGMLSRNSFLRSKKNLAISAIAVAARSAIKGGLHSEAAFTLSDLYIQRIEDTYQPEDVDDLLKESMLTLINQVKQAREQHYSEPIAKCLNFIYKRVYQPITLKDLIKQVNLHPSYLSNLFKKEVGITIRDYVHKAKIEEAISLISFSDYTITEISNLLNFTDQSHFTRIFKRVAGTTPKQYQLRRAADPSTG